MDLQERKASLESEIKAIRAEVSELQGLEKEAIENMETHLGSVEAKISSLEAKQNELKEVENDIRFEDLNAKTAKLLDVNNVTVNSGQKKLVLPASAKSRRQLKTFASDEDAYVAGRKFLAFNCNHAKSEQWLKDQGIYNVERLRGGDDDKGGYFVPSEVDYNIIRLVEEFGVARRECKRKQMNSDHAMVPVRTGGMTAYAVGEATDGSANGTSSSPTWKSIELTARKWKCWLKVSEDVNDDSIIDLIDQIVLESAQAFAESEDDSLFNGDGSNTYHGIKGLKSAIGSAGIVTGASGELAFSDLDLADYEATIAKLPAYPGQNRKWYTSQTGFWTGMVPLMHAAGGESGMNIADGKSLMFMGFPVVISNKMYNDTADSASNMAAYFGDLSQGVLFGDRRGLQTAVSADRYFDEDNWAVKVTERFDINCHSVGDSSNAGAVVALKFAAS